MIEELFVLKYVNLYLTQFSEREPESIKMFDR